MNSATTPPSSGLFKNKKHFDRFKMFMNKLDPNESPSKTKLPSKLGEAAKRSKNQENEYQEILNKMKNDFYETFGKQKPISITMEDFEKVRTLGTGSFGVVVLIKLKTSNQYYAMKVLDKAKVIKLKQVEHSLYEKNILHSIRFPFIVNMEFCFKDNSNIYFIMPFINGGEMFTHLRKMRKFDEPLAKFYAAQVCLGLEYLHHLDLVYRDLKPENILIDSKGFLKITDLGFCKIVNGRTWTLCGTPEYIAPEIILSKGYGKSVDWWSFGVLVYEMAAGLPPFFSNDPMRLYEKIVAGRYKFMPHFSNELKDLIKNILQVDLTRRYGNLKNGVADIKQHRWFREINWIQLYNKKVDPPYKPAVKTMGDATYFDQYDEEPIVVASTEKFPEEFKDF